MDTYEDGEVAHLANLIVGKFQSSDLLISNQVAQVRALNLIVTELNLKEAGHIININWDKNSKSHDESDKRDKLS